MEQSKIDVGNRLLILGVNLPSYLLRLRRIYNISLKQIMQTEQSAKWYDICTLGFTVEGLNAATSAGHFEGCNVQSVTFTL